ncbi:hypothetical protein JHK87_050420 [Glycine soja]|nr:hypothetical protein JHK87_050420 [Glycine soja]
MLISISAPQNALYYNHVRDPPGLRAFLASSTHLISLDPSLCGLSHSVSLDSYTLKRGGVAVEAVSSATVEVATLYVSLFLFRSTPNLLSLYANFLVSVNVSFSRTLCAHCLRRTLVLTVSGERLKIRTNVSDILTLHLLSVLENKTERARHHKLFTSFGGQARKESAVLFYEVLKKSILSITSYPIARRLFVMRREHAIQIAEQFEALGSEIGVKCVVVSFNLFF